MIVPRPTLATDCLPEQPGLILSEFIYETAPFPACHASTIVEVRGGLIAAWFGGTAESNPDVGIYLSRYVAGAWTAPVEVADGVQASGKRFPCYNPVLFQPRKGPLLLFYKVGTGPSGWWAMLTRSNDGGCTWSKPERLPDGILGPIKNKPIELKNGEILCPSSSEETGWRVHFERTSDLGQTWTATPPVNDPAIIGAIQPSFLIHSDHLQAIGRTQQGKIFTIDSSDNGKTWGPMGLLTLPNPNSGTDAITLRDHRFLLVFNDTTTGRTPLNVAISHDGMTWTRVITLEDTPGEFSYPAVIQTSDGKVHITYTWNRKRIKHVVIDPELIPNR
jgi:predicted neuraminidase